MQQFFYEAVAPDGQTIVGKVEAIDAAEVQRTLVHQGYRPQSIAPTQALPALTTSSMAIAVAPPVSVMPSVMTQSAVTVPRTAPNNITLAGNAARTQSRSRSSSSQTASKNATPIGSSLGGVKNSELMNFFQQFAALVKSGMTVYAALDNLAGRNANKNLAQTLREMAEAARQGSSISEVMAHYPRIYESHIVGMIRAGELGGFLDIVLGEIALNYEQNVALYKGSWMPKSLALQAYFMVPIVQPFFGSLFSSMDFAANMALYVKLVLFRNMPIAALVLLAVIVVGRSVQLPRYREWRDTMALKLPPFGELQRQASLSAFVRMLRKLYHAGVSPVFAWEAAMNTASNTVIRAKLGNAYAIMQNGGSLGDAFTATGLFDNGIEQTVITGQMSGQVVESLDQAAQFYQDKVEEYAEKSRKAMKRLGVMAMLVFGGIAMLIMAKTYFSGMFGFVERMFPEVYGGE